MLLVGMFSGLPLGTGKLIGMLFITAYMCVEQGYRDNMNKDAKLYRNNLFLRKEISIVNI